MNSKHGIGDVGGHSGERPAKFQKVAKQPLTQKSLGDKIKNHKTKHLKKTIRIKDAEIERLRREISEQSKECDEVLSQSAMLSGVWKELVETMNGLIAGFEGSLHISSSSSDIPSSLRALLNLHTDSFDDTKLAKNDINEMLKVRSQNSADILQKLLVLMTNKDNEVSSSAVQPLNQRIAALQTQVNTYSQKLVLFSSRNERLSKKNATLKEENSSLVNSIERLRADIPEVKKQENDASQVSSDTNPGSSASVPFADEDAKKAIADLNTEIQFLRENAKKDEVRILEMMDKCSNLEEKLKTSTSSSIGQSSKSIETERNEELHKILLEDEVKAVNRQLRDTLQALDFKDQTIHILVKKLEEVNDSHAKQVKEIEERSDTIYHEKLHFAAAFEKLRIENETRQKQLDDYKRVCESIQLKDPVESSVEFVQAIMESSNDIEKMLGDIVQQRSIVEKNSAGSNSALESSRECQKLRKEISELLDREKDMKVILNSLKKKASPQEIDLAQLKATLKKAEEEIKVLKNSSSSGESAGSQEPGSKPFTSLANTPPNGVETSASGDVTLLKKKLQSQTRKNKYLNSELKKIVGKFKELGKENIELTERIEKNGDNYAVLRLELQKAKDHKAMVEKVKKELEIHAEIESTEKSFRARIAELDEKLIQARMQDQYHERKKREIKSSLNELEKNFREYTQNNLGDEQTKQELRESIEDAQKNFSTVKRDYGKLEFKLKKIKDENAVLHTRIDRLKEGRKDLASENELQMYRKMVTCSVCDKRRKNVAITRCKHLFCSECIQTNLDTRHRKCPHCGKPFGHDDVIPVYLV